MTTQKKYEKAKDRFKLQRAKHADETHKAQKEHMENEKRHWRTVALAQEEAQWERSLRAETHSLLEYVELERRFEALATKKTMLTRPVAVVVKSLSPGPEQDISFQTARESEAVVFDDEEVDMDVATEDQEAYEKETTLQTMTDSAVVVAVSQPMHKRSASAKSIYDEARAMEAAIDISEFVELTHIHTPKRQQATRVPVHFGDGEDKENQTPHAVRDVLKTPMTMDRAAALAAIEYRRGRAKSFMNAQTPKKSEVTDRRDVSAPPLITMSVGRKN